MKSNSCGNTILNTNDESVENFSTNSTKDFNTNLIHYIPPEDSISVSNSLSKPNVSSDPPFPTVPQSSSPLLVVTQPIHLQSVNNAYYNSSNIPSSCSNILTDSHKVQPSNYEENKTVTSLNVKSNFNNGCMALPVISEHNSIPYINSQFKNEENYNLIQKEPINSVKEQQCHTNTSQNINSLESSVASSEFFDSINTEKKAKLVAIENIPNGEANYNKFKNKTLLESNNLGGTNTENIIKQPLRYLPPAVHMWNMQSTNAIQTSFTNLGDKSLISNLQNNTLNKSPIKGNFTSILPLSPALKPCIPNTYPTMKPPLVGNIASLKPNMNLLNPFHNLSHNFSTSSKSVVDDQQNFSFHASNDSLDDTQEDLEIDSLVKEKINNGSVFDAKGSDRENHLEVLDFNKIMKLDCNNKPFLLDCQNASNILFPLNLNDELNAKVKDILSRIANNSNKL